MEQAFNICKNCFFILVLPKICEGVLTPQIKKSFSRKNLFGLGKAIVAFALPFIASCGGGKNSSATQAPGSKAESYHADNDIAMAIRSLADAIKVGEPLDSAEYDFRGVLTDGQGTPLYTDIEGTPGIWDIDVIDSGKVAIKNIYLGDLLASDLEAYILDSLKLSYDNKLPSLNDTTTNTNRNFTSVYLLSGGYLKYEVVSETASNGMEGSKVTITLGTTDEIQIAA